MSPVEIGRAMNARPADDPRRPFTSRIGDVLVRGLDRLLSREGIFGILLVAILGFAGWFVASFVGPPTSRVIDAQADKEHAIAESWRTMAANNAEFYARMTKDHKAQSDALGVATQALQSLLEASTKNRPGSNSGA